jgi:glycosyltransferase involved in cell wall biosynthesis
MIDMKTTKHLLFIAYYFPPNGGGGTQRASKLCKYLARQGWEVSVVTRPAFSEAGAWDPPDETLMSDVTSNRISIRRTRTYGTRSLPSAWADECLGEVRSILGEREVNVVCITMSPFDLSAIMVDIQTDYDIPVVLDLRDPWALDGWQVYRHVWAAWEDRRRMKRSILLANGVVINTPEALQAIRKAVPGLSEARSVAIPNGFDAEDFDANPLPPMDAAAGFTLVHTGSLHDYVLSTPKTVRGTLGAALRYRPERIQPGGRTAKYLAKALRSLKSKDPKLYAQLQVVLVGRCDDHTRRSIKAEGVQDKVKITGYVSHSESIAWLKRADALFLPLHGLPPGYRSLIVPGKTYEYVASGKPILGAVPPGDARDILDEYGRAAIADPVDPVEIAAGLERVAMLAKDSTDWSFPSSLRRFRRDLLAQRFSSFLEHVIREHRENGRRESRKGRELVR